MEFDPKYHEQEQALEQKQAEVLERNEALKASIKDRADLSDEERADAYMEGHAELTQELQDAADALISQVESERSELRRKVHAGTGERFGEYLIDLAGKSEEELRPLMQTALRTGQEDLARAIAQTAYEKNLSGLGLFAEWAEANPETSEALERLNSLPSHDRLEARAKARTFVPKAGLQSLMPSPAALERARRAAAEEQERAERERIAKAMQREQFFRQPLRRVGRRSA